MPINLTPHALLFTIAAIGISEASYLIRKRIAAERPVCPIGQGCATVLNSKYNRMVLGIPNDLLGIAFYVSLSAVAALIVIGGDNLTLFVNIAKILLLGGTIMSATLTYLQWKVIRAWCFWCVMSAITVGLMDIIILTFKLT